MGLKVGEKGRACSYLIHCITVSISLNGRDCGGHDLLILPSFSDLMIGIANTAGKIPGDGRCWMWCLLAVSCMKVLTPIRDDICKTTSCRLDRDRVTFRYKSLALL